MSRKGVGLAAFDRSRLTSAHYASHGSSLRASNAQALETQLAVFRSLLQQFANTHARDIRSDPAFRAQFARMCAAIGVDPLASSNSSAEGGGGGSSSIWAQLLGKTVNDFYFELAVRIVEVCGATRGENGGLIGLAELRERVAAGRMDGADPIADDDVRRAVQTLAPLGGSYAVVKVGRKEYIRSVPRELNDDQVAVVEAVQVLGYVSVGMLSDNLGWDRARAKTVIDDLVAGGMLWVDKQTKGEWEYWSPGFMADAGGAEEGG
ncbi:ESCRT II complex subunit Dot2 [Fusarium solani]|jgi:ESCRT-II complex subunit VPS22|uniref:Vacuolar-sorting protein SNF8 n=3 Tax=Fusarium solani species complex TaxID=232080 RepID=A0A9W8V3W5_9HYPO|nr:EAP30/Vps36 family-domain-containing protein [Fusarium solani]XP_052912390.1 Vacuolar-sorting protein SNF8 [Fusarium keratoplasticum]XP_053009686.1 Vacuolar-sorting protein SNF8 [Fusarium falciforme]KAI8667272.1 Vacuolar-sorting protein SNF8 [Fusarium sp. Ph1]KAH7260209.1 EAP30/Vps36 family-domain-containing protein [Fusarium solani]KAI8666503.1 Vacuolar-sorting protein SNF8 [Fusarium keratoplasticum]KAI8668201.1 Vacuolar-sorting protein SNF8 [Fusarium keratoplasticum]KAJ3464065.1 hypothe